MSPDSVLMTSVAAREVAAGSLERVNPLRTSPDCVWTSTSTMSPESRSGVDGTGNEGV